MSLYLFEESNLLLYGSGGVSFGNKFPYISFYIKMLLESENSSNERQLLYGYVTDLFTEVLATLNKT